MTHCEFILNSLKHSILN